MPPKIGRTQQDWKHIALHPPFGLRGRTVEQLLGKLRLDYKSRALKPAVSTFAVLWLMLSTRARSPCMPMLAIAMTSTTFP
jgi:hypothetical protein